MGLTEWIRKYYPSKASECTKTEALQHSRQKWHGLKPENLKEFGCEILDGEVGLCVIDSNFIHNEKFRFGGSTCSLCQIYRDCQGCPIRNAGARCDDFDSAYQMVLSRRVDVAIMIDLLDRLYREEQQMLIDKL